MSKFFETASFHIVKPCNMKCKFCYATYDDLHVINQLPLIDAFAIIQKLQAAGLQKITFAGGEPLLYKNIKEVIEFSSRIGLVTSIITNGSLLTDAWLKEMRHHLNWIGVSIDSLDPETNSKIGRTTKTGSVPNKAYYIDLVERIKHYGYKLKINTVVNMENVTEDMTEFIYWAKPARWKVFQTLRVKGQNDVHWDKIKVSDAGFKHFIKRHRWQEPVWEDNERMTASYLLIDPLGRFFENSKGTHTYSDPLQDNTIEHCLSQINLDREMFLERGGVYQW